MADASTTEAPPVTDSVAPTEPVEMDQDREQPAAEVHEEEPEQGAEPEAEPAAATKKNSPKKEPAARKPAVSPGSTRERKKVEHFKPAEVSETKRLVVKEGKGTKLRDIPNVHFKMSKITGRDEVMEVLHEVMYKRRGQAGTRKRDILDFSGFTSDSDSKAADLEKASAKLGRLKKEVLHQLLDLFELPRGSGEEGHKDAQVKRITTWLEAPAANSTKDLAAKAEKKKASTKRKREKTAASAEKTPAAKKSKGTAKDKDQKSAAKARVSPSKPAAKAKRQKTSPAPPPAPEEEDDSGDELPLGAVAKMPTDDALIEKVQEILSGVDVQEFHLKGLMKELAKQYGIDLAPKKPLIKATAIQYCHDSAPAADEDQEADVPGDDAPEGAAVAEAAEKVAEKQPVAEAAAEAEEAAAEAQEAAE